MQLSIVTCCLYSNSNVEKLRVEEGNIVEMEKKEKESEERREVTGRSFSNINTSPPCDFQHSSHGITSSFPAPPPPQICVL